MKTSRRTFLTGVSTTIALPWLESLARAQSSVRPRRFLAYFVPNGMNMSAFTPTTDAALPQILEPLEAMRDDLLILSGLANPAANHPSPGDHARGTASFLTCEPITRSEGREVQNGVSVDQILAEKLPIETPFRSLQLGAEGGVDDGTCDSGYSCAYARNISWADAATPLPKMVEPALVFDLLVSGDDPATSLAQREQDRQRRKSVLDHVLDDTARLSSRLGRRDRAKLDQYLTGLREVERRLARFTSVAACGSHDRPAMDVQTEERVRLMGDLVVMAFECDLTRVATFMLGNGASNRAFDFLGVPDAHHELSHHAEHPAKLAALTKIGRWEVECFGRVVQRLSEIEVGDRRLLDDTVAVFSSEISDGDTHAHDDLPVLVATGSPRITRGQHLTFDDTSSIANLYLALMEAFGVRGTSFERNDREILSAVLA